MFIKFCCKYTTQIGKTKFQLLINVKSLCDIKTAQPIQGQAVYIVGVGIYSIGFSNPFS